MDCGRAADVLQPWHLRQQVVVRVNARLAWSVVPRTAVFVDLPDVAAWQTYRFRADRHPAGPYELLYLLRQRRTLSSRHTILSSTGSK